MFVLLIAALAAWVFVWFLVAIRVFRRDDIGGGGKALLIVAILVFPIVGLFIYFLWDAARPRTT
jgi:hypothetical protein